MKSRLRNRASALAGLALVVLAPGCATKKYVAAEVAASEGRVEERVGERLDGVETQVEANQARLDEQERDLQELSRTAQDALTRAVAAGKLAEGKFVFEQVLTDESVRFGPDDAKLSRAAEQALDAFASRLVEENSNVFVEIQGHTDASGPDDHNLRLGQRRADAVLRHLNLAHGIPLHRMSAISYGETAPMADNSTPEGRAANRRVVLVVLR